MKALFETLLTRALAMDPESPARLLRLQGKVVGIQLRGVAFHCQMVFQDSAVSLRFLDFLPEDLVICGTPLRLLQLRFTKDRQRFFADDVTVTGNLALAQDVMAIFDKWQPDWEEWASHCVGDVPAHQAGRFLRRAAQTVRELSQRFTENLSEYLQEELSVCPPREAVEDFLNEVDALRLQVDRLEARLARLRSGA